jgi:hypothetical protein
MSKPSGKVLNALATGPLGRPARTSSCRGEAADGPHQRGHRHANQAFAGTLAPGKVISYPERARSRQFHDAGERPRARLERAGYGPGGSCSELARARSIGP